MIDLLLLDETSSEEEAAWAAARAAMQDEGQAFVRRVCAWPAATCSRSRPGGVISPSLT